MTIEETLLTQYGPLMTVVALATMLDRSPEGLRMCLRGDSKWANDVNRTKLQIGRRLYFRTTEIARIVACNDQQ